MGMFDQLNLDAVKKLYRAELPTPVDVLNLIHFKDEEAYKWYGVMVLPLLKLVGADVGWMGTHVEAIIGEPRAEELLVVRYPNQRRFFALALNPYYIVVANRQRMKAVRKFEASFTHSSHSLGPLAQSTWILAVHLHGTSEAMVETVESSGGHLVYESVETSPIVISKRAHPANTNPLVFKRTCLFRFEDQQACEAAMHESVIDQIGRAAGECSVQLYRRVPRREAMPKGFSGLLSRRRQ